MGLLFIKLIEDELHCKIYSWLSSRYKGFLYTIFNRRRWFPNINDTNFQLRAQSERQAVNFRVQGMYDGTCGRNGRFILI